jgi:hypothetical protein
MSIHHEDCRSEAHSTYTEFCLPLSYVDRRLSRMGFLLATQYFLGYHLTAIIWDYSCQIVLLESSLFLPMWCCWTTKLDDFLIISSFLPMHFCQKLDFVWQTSKEDSQLQTILYPKNGCIITLYIYNWSVIIMAVS